MGRAFLSLGLALVALTGCRHAPTSPDDDGGGPPPMDGLVSVRVEPADATLVLADETPLSQDYRAIGTFADGSERDVSDEAQFALVADYAFGAFEGARFTSGTNSGGQGRVEASVGAVLARTEITVVLQRRVHGVGGDPLPADPASLFTGTESPSRAPELVYPSDGVILPPNLGRIELHFLRGDAQNTVFEIAFSNTVTDVRAYMRCAGLAGAREDGCVWEMNGAVWDWIATSNVGGAPLEVRVSAADESGASFGRSEPISVQFPADDLLGALYYWATTDNTAIMRYDFGSRAVPTRVLGPAQTDTGRCVGCHTLSRDGRKIVASVGGQLAGGMLLYDLTRSVPLRNETAEEDHILQFASFSPDGNELVGVWGDRLEVADLLLFDTRCDEANLLTCGMPTGSIALGGLAASHPDWSPDGTRIAFADIGARYTSQRFRDATISYVERVGAGWSAPRTMLERVINTNRFFPHYAPDSSFLVFNESSCEPDDPLMYACNGDSDPNATIHAMARDGGTPIRLARAQEPGPFDTSSDLSNTYPRFAPSVFALSRTEGGRRLMWLTFSSNRHVGIRSPGPSLSGETTVGRWLWIAAIDPDAIARGEDPSRPAFALPFQDFGTSNHNAVWTTQITGP